ncbi:MAG: RES family NAD+ phosphorylase [Chloroflexi bacterium]|nr:RES family NAD+ phosphorylase [Chloroflexota bacterium]
MPKLPDPPSASELANRLPARVVTLPAGGELWRISFQGGDYSAHWASFRHYGPLLSARFDHHLPPPHQQERGILYAASEIITCVAEVFQAIRLIDPHDRLPWLVGFRLRRDVPLLDLSSGWPTAAGASMLINAGRRDRTRAWSRAIYHAYPRVEGLHYCSSMYANRPAVALYERAADSIDPSPIFHRELADPSLLDSLRRFAVELGYELS